MPVTQCYHEGTPGYRWGQQGTCYTGLGAKAKAIKQGRAARAQGATQGATHNAKQSTRKKVASPLRADPTRTTTLRRRFETEMRKRFNRLKAKIKHLLVVEDVFGLRPKNLNPLSIGNTLGSPRNEATMGVANIGPPANHAESISASPVYNQRWRFLTDDAKVDQFGQWLGTQYPDIVPGELGNVDDAWFTAYTEEGYRKGAGRAFDDVRKPMLASGNEGNMSWFAGSRDEFLRQSFARPVAIGKVKLLAGRVFTELKGVTQTMSQQLTRELADGLVQGMSPREISRRMANRVDNLTRTRANVIARTEIIRAHGEGQLDALETLGVDKVGVMAEWSTTGDDRVCQLCLPLEGSVLSVKEARGLLPRHPNCRCAYVPAMPDWLEKPPPTQLRTKAKVDKAFEKSIRGEIPKGQLRKRSLAQQKARSRWPGADRKIRKRPRRRPVDVPQPGARAGVPKEWMAELTEAEKAEFKSLVKERAKLNKSIKNLEGKLSDDASNVRAAYKQRLEVVKGDIKAYRTLMKERTEAKGIKIAKHQPKPKTKKPAAPEAHPASLVEPPAPIRSGDILDDIANNQYLDDIQRQVVAAGDDPWIEKMTRVLDDKVDESIKASDKLYDEILEAKQKWINANQDGIVGFEPIYDVDGSRVHDFFDTLEGQRFNKLARELKEATTANRQALLEHLTTGKNKDVYRILEVLEEDRAHITYTRAKTTHHDPFAGGKTVSHKNKTDNLFRAKADEAKDWLTSLTRRRQQGLSPAQLKELTEQIGDTKKLLHDNEMWLKAKTRDLDEMQTILSDWRKAGSPLDDTGHIPITGEFSAQSNQWTDAKLRMRIKKLELDRDVYFKEVGETRQKIWKLEDAQKIAQTGGKVVEFDGFDIPLHRLKTKKRAFQRSKPQTTQGIYCSDTSDVSTFIHEFMHRYEDEIPGLLKQAQQFKDMRIARSGKPVVNFKKKWPGSNYKPYEEGSPDDFEKVYKAIGRTSESASRSAHYVGKSYDDATEILTMGIQMVYENPVEFARADPEWFKFVVGMLKGTL